MQPRVFGRCHHADTGGECCRRDMCGVGTLLECLQSSMVERVKESRRALEACRTEEERAEQELGEMGISLNHDGLALRAVPSATSGLSVGLAHELLTACAIFSTEGVALSEPATSTAKPRVQKLHA